MPKKIYVYKLLPNKVRNTTKFMLTDSLQWLVGRKGATNIIICYSFGKTNWNIDLKKGNASVCLERIGKIKQIKHDEMRGSLPHFEIIFIFYMHIVCGYWMMITKK